MNGQNSNWYTEAKRVCNIQVVKIGDPEYLISYCKRQKEELERIESIKLLYKVR